LALSKKWKVTEEAYRQWYKSQEEFSLGDVQFVHVADDIISRQYDRTAGYLQKYKWITSIRYEAVRPIMLKKSSLVCNGTEGSIHMPRIGCGLAGGKWELIEQIIKEELIDKEIAVTVYDL
jgi:hypothetical protein